jgi:hypothetical protein
MIIAVPEKYALEVGSPTPITSERQHARYLSVLDKLAHKDNRTTEEEKYAEVLMTLIAAYEEEHHFHHTGSIGLALSLRKFLRRAVVFIVGDAVDQPALRSAAGSPIASDQTCGLSASNKTTIPRDSRRPAFQMS